MNKEEIIKDIERIISIQKLEIEKTSNSFRYIFEEESDLDLEYDLEDFKRKCVWKNLCLEAISKKKDSEGYNQLFELSESFIDYFSEDIGWYLLSRNISLSEGYIEKNWRKVSWAMISQFQNLSEEFIERNCDKVSWSKISLGQRRLSENFIWKYKQKLNINNVIINNKVISQEFINKIKEYRWL